MKFTSQDSTSLVNDFNVEDMSLHKNVSSHGRERERKIATIIDGNRVLKP